MMKQRWTWIRRGSKNIFFLHTPASTTCLFSPLPSKITFTFLGKASPLIFFSLWYIAFFHLRAPGKGFYPINLNFEVSTFPWRRINHLLQEDGVVSIEASLTVGYHLPRVRPFLLPSCSLLPTSVKDGRRVGGSPLVEWTFHVRGNMFILLALKAHGLELLAKMQLSALDCRTHCYERGSSRSGCGAAHFLQTGTSMPLKCTVERTSPILFIWLLPYD